MSVKRILFSAVIVTIVIVFFLLLEEETTLLKAGDIAPDFSAMSNTGEQIHLHDYRGKNLVILYFYPKDFTLGCTEQACSFRDAFDTLRHFGAVIIGVSPDDISSHARFVSAYKLPLTLLSDTDKSISRAYGAVWLGGMVPPVKRVTYLIDTNGIIRGVSHHEFIVSRHLDDMLDALKNCTAGK